MSKFTYNYTNSFDGIVSISGDGLIHEIINGLLNRKDHYYNKRKIPIGIIPGGSGDGLAKALLERSGEKLGLEQACLLIIKGQTRLMDITKIISNSRSDPIYSFLSVAWCIISDIDLESEKVRWMGDTRFTLWGVIRTLKIRRYQAALSYRGSDITHRNQTLKDIGLDLISSSNYNMFNFSNKDEEVEESKFESNEEIWSPYDCNTKDHLSLMEPVPKNWNTLESK